MTKPRLAGGGRWWPSLTVRFGVLSAVLALLTAGVLQHALSTMIDERARQEAMRSAGFVTRVAIEPVLSGRDLTDGDLPAAQRAELDAVVQHAFAQGELRRVKIFDPDFRIVFTDDPEQLGTHSHGYQQVEDALAGRSGSKFAGHVDRGHLGEKGLGRLLEVFVPLQLDGDGRPDGVVELYVPHAPIAAAVEQDSRRLLLLLAAGLGGLWLALLRVVMVVSRRLHRELARNEHSARHDALTGLPNRNLLFDRIERAVADDRRAGTGCAVLLLDLDRFKDVNDTLGHHNGDLLLREVGARLGSVLREGDTLARLGGDEFAVLLPAAVDAHTTAQRLVTAVEAPFELQGVSLQLGISVGIALAPAHGDTPELLLQRADIAMYAAKRGHADVVAYSAECDDHSPDRLALLAGLRQALDTGELLLHYQPKVEVASGRLAGVEALVRWAHPTRGLVPPDVFVPLAEQSGLITAVTEWVLRRALETAAGWRAAGVDLEVSVNVSARDLADAALLDVVTRALHETSTPRGRLVLEITETALLADPATARGVLHRLRDLGVRVSIDDFGRGYSSLAYLQRLPVDELKIDRSFVAGLGDHDRDRAIVRSAVELGRNLGLRVVAEGVETASAWAALRDLGCDQLQGYHVSRPLPAAELLAWRTAYVATADGPVPAATSG